jgi:hypothetical protein
MENRSSKFDLSTLHSCKASAHSPLVAIVVMNKARFQEPFHGNKIYESLRAHITLEAYS